MAHARRLPDPQDQLAPPAGASIADRIKDRLQALNMSALELGRRVSPTRPGNVYDWLGGRQNPSAETLRAIARELGMSTDELLGIAAGQKPPFDAWDEFLKVLEKRKDALEKWERDALVSVSIPSGKQPTVATYELHLAALRSTLVPRS